MKLWFWVCSKFRKLFGMKRRLYGTWIVESADDMECLYGMDAVDEIAKYISDEINSYSET